MTDVIFLSPEAFIRHLGVAYSLSLDPTDQDLVKVLHALHPEKLRTVHWRLENDWASLQRDAEGGTSGKAKGRGKAEGEGLEKMRDKVGVKFKRKLREAAAGLDEDMAISQDIEELEIDSSTIDGNPSPTRSCSSSTRMSISPTRPPAPLSALQTPKTKPSTLESPSKTVRPFSRMDSSNSAAATNQNSPLLRSGTGTGAGTGSGRGMSRTDSAGSILSSTSVSRPGAYLEPGSPMKRARSDPIQPPPSVKLGFGEAYDVTAQQQGISNVFLQRHLETPHAEVSWTLRFWISSLVGSGKKLGSSRSHGESLGWNSISATDWRELRERDGMGGAAYLSQKFGIHVPFEVQKALREGDLEDAALKGDEMAGLGFSDRGEEGRGYYGGKVHFWAKVKKHGAGGFFIVVGPPKAGSSNRFARRFGSSSFVRLQIDDECKRGSSQDLHSFLRRPFVFLGKRFVPLYARDSVLFLLRLDDGCPHRKSLFDFLEWHGSWALNQKSPLLKYMQRTALGLSTSVPGIKFEQSLVSAERDVEGAGVNGNFKPAACMTDGASFITAAAMVELSSNLGYNTVPCSIQGRIGGAKGVWSFLFDVDDHRLSPDERKRISLRESQIKLKRPFREAGVLWDPSMLILDVVAPSRLSFPSSLSQQILVVLSHNGVPTDVLVALQKKQIQDAFEELASLRKGDGLRMARIIDEKGGITMTWAKNIAAHEARAKGLATRQATDEADIDDGEAMEEDVLLSSNPEASKAISIFHIVYDMLMAGFDPTESSYLLDKMASVSKVLMDRLVKKFQINLPRSTELMVMPDPSHKLKPGQICVNFSRPDQVIDPGTRMSIPHLCGPVLVTRHPCLLPTDIQKVEAVVLPELSRYQDVVLFSVQGNRPLADLLSGGDYDGDLVRIIWEPSIVQPFKNADLVYSLPPREIESHFEKETLTVGEFLKDVKIAKKREEELINRVVRPITAPSQTGIYGILHRNSAYINGCSHPWTVQLAHKFASVLDGTKTGVRIKTEWFRKDRQTFDCAMPEWAEKETEEMDDFNRSSKVNKPRNPALPPSIHDKLAAAGRQEAISLSEKWQRRLEETVFSPDEDLLRPWREAREKGRLSNEQVEAIKEHVENVYASYVSSGQEYARSKAAQSSALGYSKSSTHSALAKLKSQREEIGVTYRRWATSSVICGVPSTVVRGTGVRRGVDLQTSASSSSSTTSLNSTLSLSTGQGGGQLQPPSRPVSPSTPLTLSPLADSRAFQPTSTTPTAPSSSAASTVPAASLDALELQRLRLILASCVYTTNVEASQRKAARQREFSNGSNHSTSSLGGAAPGVGGSGGASSSDRFEAKFAFEVALAELCVIKAQAVALKAGEMPKVLPPMTARSLRLNRQALVASAESEEAELFERARRGLAQREGSDVDVGVIEGGDGAVMMGGDAKKQDGAGASQLDDAFAQAFFEDEDEDVDLLL